MTEHRRLLKQKLPTKQEAEIIKFEILNHYRIKITFADNFTGIVDLSHLVGKGVFKSWENIKKFREVEIDSITKTLCWNKEIDLDPYKLRSDAEARSADL